MTDIYKAFDQAYEDWKKEAPNWDTMPKMKTPEDEEFERIERKQNELIQVASSLSKDAEDIRNKVLEEVAQEIEKLKGFGEDTIASFTVYIRSMKK